MVKSKSKLDILIKQFKILIQGYPKNDSKTIYVLNETLLFVEMFEFIRINPYIIKKNQWVQNSYGKWLQAKK